MKATKPALFLDRKFLRVLEAWKKRADRLPLIVKGARQVGKTECIRHFAAGRYRSLVEINFALRPEFKAAVRDGYSAENVVRNLSFVDPRLHFHPGDTLLFFDEIQDFPEIATTFKSFAEDGRFDVVASGSLLGVHLKRIESIAVGYQETETMRSLDFEEFLAAVGYSAAQVDDLFGHLVEARPFGPATTEAIGRFFSDFCAVGGMPEADAKYVSTGTFERIPDIQRRIARDYRSDVRKYAEGLDPLRIVAVFDSVPAQLAKENRKFQLARIEKGATGGAASSGSKTRAW